MKLRANWFAFLSTISIFLAEQVDSIADQSDHEGEDPSKRQVGWWHWWSYDGISGPDYWSINKQWKICSIGRLQSPIEIRTDRLIYDHLLEPIGLSWIEDQQPSNGETSNQIKVQLLNSGRGLEVWPKSESDILQLDRGPLSYAYRLYKIELHSALSRSSPIPAYEASTSSAKEPLATFQDDFDTLKLGKTSEHLIDGRAFDGELQLHFYNSHLISTSTDAKRLAEDSEESRSNLFAVICVFLLTRRPSQLMPEPELYSDSKASSQMNENLFNPLDFIWDNLGSISAEGNSIELRLNRSQIESLVPNKRHYVTYQGSQNRPPCAENVDWIILNQALRVDGRKYQFLFENLSTSQENIRPVKPLYGRLLRTTINFESSHGLPVQPTVCEKSQTNSSLTPEAAKCNETNLNEAKRMELGLSCNMRPNYVYQLKYRQDKPTD